jgi:membrane protease YdiL (CAAX protease family)
LRTSHGRLRAPWQAVLLVCILRLGLLTVTQVALFIAFKSSGSRLPWTAALSYANFYTSIPVDLVTLLVLVWLLHGEGINLGELIGLERHRLGRDLLIGVALFVVLYVVFVLGSLMGALLAYGPSVFSSPPSGHLEGYAPPLWVLWWATIVLPVSVSFAEELTYRGYALPRIAGLTGSTGAGVLLSSLAFGLQHVALPLVGVQVAISRVVPTFLAGLVLALLYVKLKRLLPLMVGHWLLDFVALGLLPLLVAVKS